MSGIAWDTFMWLDELQTIIDDWTEGVDEPLDGDDVDVLTEVIRSKLNFMQGNITLDEYMNG